MIPFKKIFTIFLLTTFIIPTTACSTDEKTIPTEVIEQKIPDKEIKEPNEFILYDNATLKKLKASSEKPVEIKASIDKVIKYADSALKLESFSVTQKKSYVEGATPNDYVSMAIYYWPDTTKAGGKPYIKKDGLVNPERSNNDIYDATRLSKMVDAVNNLSLAYYFTDKEDYAKQSAKLLRTWFLDSATKMNANLQFAQLVPGKNTGGYSGIIDTTVLIPLLDSIEMLQSSQSWSKEDNAELKKWFSAYTDWLLTSAPGIKESQTTNNHGVWYDAQVAAFSLYADRQDITKKISEEAKKKRINTQIEKEGSMPRELSRTRSMHYTTYNLQAFITLARIADKVGVDLWNYQSEDGKSIKLALDYVYPYLDDKSKWKYETIVEDSEKGFAPYLAIAAKYYKNTDYAKSSSNLLTNETSKLNIQVYSLLANQ